MAIELGQKVNLTEPWVCRTHSEDALAMQDQYSPHKCYLGGRFCAGVLILRCSMTICEISLYKISYLADIVAAKLRERANDPERAIVARNGSVTALRADGAVAIFPPPHPRRKT